MAGREIPEGVVDGIGCVLIDSFIPESLPAARRACFQLYWKDGPGILEL